MSRTELHVHARVQEDHRIEVRAPELRVGDEVEVVILAPESTAQQSEGRKSVLDIIRELPPGQLFKTAADVERYLKEERDSWER